MVGLISLMRAMKSKSTRMSQHPVSSQYSGRMWFISRLTRALLCNLGCPRLLFLAGLRVLLVLFVLLAVLPPFKLCLVGLHRANPTSYPVAMVPIWIRSWSIC